MIKSETTAKLAEALAKAQGAMKHAVKDSDNPYFKSKYADLASVWDVCRRELSENGLAVVQMPSFHEGQMKLTYILMHSSGEYIGDELPMTPVKSDPQGIGSAITYARRYTLAGIAGVATEDDDGNEASGNAGNAKPEAKRTTEPVPVKRPAKKAEAPAEEPPPYDDVPPPEDEAILPPESDRIETKDAQYLHKRFREALRPDIQREAEKLLHDWLGVKLYLDEHGNPSAKAIRKDEFKGVGKAAIEYAKTL